MFFLTDLTDARLMDGIRANPHAGVRSALHAVGTDAVQAVLERCYGEPIPTPHGGRVFPEDN